MVTAAVQALERVLVPQVPALVAGFREVVWLSPEGEIEALSPDEAATASAYQAAHPDVFGALALLRAGQAPAWAAELVNKAELAGSMRGLSQGRATCSMEPSAYGPAPPEVFSVSRAPKERVISCSSTRRKE